MSHVGTEEFNSVDVEHEAVEPIDSKMDESDLGRMNRLNDIKWWLMKSERLGEEGKCTRG